MLRRYEKSCLRLLYTNLFNPVRFTLASMLGTSFKYYCAFSWSKKHAIGCEITSDSWILVINYNLSSLFIRPADGTKNNFPSQLSERLKDEWPSCSPCPCVNKLNLQFSNSNGQTLCVFSLARAARAQSPEQIVSPAEFHNALIVPIYLNNILFYEYICTRTTATSKTTTIMLTIIVLIYHNICS